MGDPKYPGHGVEDQFPGDDHESHYAAPEAHRKLRSLGREISDALNDDLHEARRKAAIDATANAGLSPAAVLPPKQVIVMRKDLGMRKGKRIAQGAHASMKVLLDRCAYSGMSSPPEHRWTFYTEDESWKRWLEGLFTKVVVTVASESELLEVYERAKTATLPCALIEDAGLTEFKGVPTKTCCAIGPASPEAIDRITGHLKLL